MAGTYRKAKMNDLIIDTHAKKVMEKQAMITKTRDLVPLMTPEDPMQPAQIQILIQVNDESKRP